MAAGGFSFRKALPSVVLIEEDLTLKVRWFNEVSIDDRDGPGARPGEKRRRRRTHRATSDNGDVCFGKPLLALSPDTRKQNLARITLPFGHAVQVQGGGRGGGFVGTHRYS